MAAKNYGHKCFITERKQREMGHNTEPLFVNKPPDVQCDHIVAETPNLDVLGIEMSLIFGKCRLAFFVAFKAKRVIFMAFSI